MVRQIGGDEAKNILAEALAQTKHGVELAYVTQLLEELSPGEYRDTALTAARGLLASATGGDRDYLFSMLQQFGDTSYASTAQAQLVQADGKVDRSALRYLQQTLGEQSVALAAQTYRDARVTRNGDAGTAGQRSRAQVIPLGTNAGHSTTGSLCRSERIAKYYRRHAIKRELGKKARDGGSAFKAGRM
ncbi:MAG: hypothetical protein M1546_05835 [Chloroflexi bacterium]|nr:hypothetical protein [Chloroflexota bacterium]